MHPATLIKELDKYRTASDSKPLLYLAMKKQRVNPRPTITMINLGFSEYELYKDGVEDGEAPDLQSFKYSSIDKVVKWYRNMGGGNNSAMRSTFIAHLENPLSVNLEVEDLSSKTGALVKFKQHKKA